MQETKVFGCPHLDVAGSPQRLRASHVRERISSRSCQGRNRSVSLLLGFSWGWAFVLGQYSLLLVQIR